MNCKKIEKFSNFLRISKLLLPGTFLLCWRLPSELMRTRGETMQ